LPTTPTRLLSIVSDTEDQKVEDELNSRPRKILDYRTPREVFFNAKTLSVSMIRHRSAIALISPAAQ
jgi:hypothetical protein